jgi:Protein of unknown function (DUF4238)
MRTVGSQKGPDRNRLDHLLPQGYLEGFTDPAQGRLCVFDIEQRRWFPSSPRAVAAAHGYYDYSDGSNPDATADEVFADFESSFPVVRRELVASNFMNWTKHREFLVRYSQMLRARSDLFREEVLKEANSATFLKIDEVLQMRPSVTRPGGTEYILRYSDFQAHCEPHLFKNMSITKMRAEIAKGAGEFAAWHWCLHFTADLTMPVITGDNAVRLMGSGRFSRDEAMKHPDTKFVFPLCWQACLIGSPLRFDTETEIIHPKLIEELHRLY